MKKYFFYLFSLLLINTSHSQYWSKLTGNNIFDNPIYALYTDNATNSLYIGGDFISPSNYITRWDGSSYNSLGTGLNGDVFAITNFNGDIYAAGAFSTAGGLAANNIARWNGTSWSALALGTNGQVNALVVFNNELYAGGSFTMAGGATANYIAKWNGTSWTTVGTGMNAKVNSLIVFNGALYAGGDFITAGGNSANYIAKWNSTAWSALGSGMDNWVNGLGIYNNALYAGGRFANAGGMPASKIAKWSGTTWSTLGTGLNGDANCFAVYNNEFYVGGAFSSAGGLSASKIARWNGTTWNDVAGGLGNTVLTLAVYKGQLYAAGYISWYIQRWDNIAPGTITFQKVYGGSSGGNESIYNGIGQTNDWGYVLCGATQGYGSGSSDMFVTKTDTIGNIVWSEVWGGSAYDGANALAVNSSGDIIVAGQTQSYGTGSNDMFAIRVSADGNSSWKRTYGGSGSETAWGVKQTADGGYILGGTIGQDAMLVKIFASGDTAWTKKYGTASLEGIYSLELSNTGGYLLTGYTGSPPNYKVYVLYVNSTGTIVWDKAIGGALPDYGYRTKQTSDGGFIVVGKTKSFGAANYDGYVVKLDASGNTSWSKIYGGGLDESFYDVHETYNGYVFLGGTGSFGKGGEDVYVIKTSLNGTMQWSKTFGGTNSENNSWAMQRTHDNGYAILSQTNSFPYSGGIDINMYLIKTDSLLNIGTCHQTNGGGTETTVTSISNSAGSIASKSGISVTIPVPAQISAPFTAYELNLSSTVSKVNVTCNSFANGQASVSVSNGLSPYTYSWSNGGSTSAISNLVAGNYTITVSDATSCSSTNTVAISQPAALNIANNNVNVSCYGGNKGLIDIAPTGGTIPYSYSWSNNATTQDISGLTAGSYSVLLTDANSCTASASFTITSLLPPVSICVVTVDTITHDRNRIVWEKPITAGIDSFRIYRNISAVMTHIASVPFSNLSIFADTTNGVNPKIQAYEYAISAIDTCGNESALSSTHITIHQLTPAFTPPSTFDLVWSDYQGFSFADYDIWRDGNNTNNWTKIGSVLFTLANQYTDLTAPTDSARYRIVAVPAQPCVATTKNPNPMATSVKSSKSNSSEKTIGPVTVIENPILESIIISPNPNTGTFEVFCNNISVQSITVYSMIGEVIYSSVGSTKKISVTIPEISNGVYLLKIKSENGILNTKIVISR